jgi:hypothetical protein
MRGRLPISRLNSTMIHTEYGQVRLRRTCRGNDKLFMFPPATTKLHQFRNAQSVAVFLCQFHLSCSRTPQDRGTHLPESLQARYQPKYSAHIGSWLNHEATWNLCVAVRFIGAVPIPSVCVDSYASCGIPCRRLPLLPTRESPVGEIAQRTRTLGQL